MIIRTIVAVSTLLLSVELWAQEPNPDLEQALTKLCRKHKVPSLTVAAVRSDQVLTMACAGLRKRGTNSKIDLADRRPIGSNGKSITAVIAAVVVESGENQLGHHHFRGLAKTGQKASAPKVARCHFERVTLSPKWIAERFGWRRMVFIF